MYRVLAEHRERPMRVLDLAFGGSEHPRLWKLERSKRRLRMAHDEARAHVQDLLACGDLREVEPAAYLFTGERALEARLTQSLERARERYRQLELRCRGSSQEARVDWQQGALSLD